MIVENGMVAIHDQYRIDDLRDDIKEMIKAVEKDDVDWMGYTSWDV